MQIWGKLSYERETANTRKYRSTAFNSSNSEC